MASNKMANNKMANNKMADRVVAASNAESPGKSEGKFVAAIVWKNALGFLFGHVMALHAAYLVLTVGHPLTFAWAYFLAAVSGIGVTVGAHRLFSHRSYKANTFVRGLLLLAHTIAGQNCMYVWVRDHRQHHKHSDTSADPHDSSRGFFFSHIGWLMVRKHPDVIRAGAHIDMSDLEADKLVMFQKKHYQPLYWTFAALLPVLVPCYFWSETTWNSVLIAYFGRYAYILNVTWMVNSAAHLFGNKPYDKNTAPRENRLVAFLGWGEGWHNYHHAFPWDYRTSEYGMRFNTNASIIEMFAKLGWATDLRSASKGVVMDKVHLKGDGSHDAMAPKGEASTGWKRVGDEAMSSVWHILGTLPVGLIFGIVFYWRYLASCFSGKP